MHKIRAHFQAGELIQKHFVIVYLSSVNSLECRSQENMCSSKNNFGFRGFFIATSF